MKRLNWRLTGIALIGLICLGLVTDVSDNLYEISKNLDIFGRLYREVNTLYVDETQPTRLMRTGIDAMLGTLDPYTTFISEDEAEEVTFMSTGQYAGVGALVGRRDGRIVILETYEGYPADRAGLRPGDQLLGVDTVTFNERTQVADVRLLLRGTQGSGVSIRFLRQGEPAARTVALSRDQIKINNVPYAGMLDAETGYIVLTGFTQDASLEVTQALKTLRAAHPALKSLVLDLRDNPGGRLDEAIRVANVFIPQQERIVETRGRLEGSQKTYLATQPAADAEIPLVVLINARTASAAEIVAGAVQDLDRGVIMGEKSFGKGLVQNIRQLSYNTQLKITTAKYYTPSGRCIQAIDYADRNAQGDATRIPDSLRQAFKTRNGRMVYDGGGIEPDLPALAPALAPVTRELERQGVIFDFVTRFMASHPALTVNREYQVDDNTFQAFIAYVKERKFSYQTPVSAEYEALRAAAQAEQPDATWSPALEAIGTRLASLHAEEIARHRAEIEARIRREMLARHLYKKGEIEAGLGTDPVLLAAAALLHDTGRYRQLLTKP
ncbi:MAG: S41 family peptidase [Bacteroidia bacterium]|nr:S41 family peptidase [Bacteroidia bacterium]